ncbi:RNA polymerase subunit sigma-70 [Streptomycetaceae bacterium NBC_01309]
MGEDDFLAARFAAERARLRAVAYRMLGSSHEADDALREAWRRLSRTDVRSVDNLAGWLSIVVGRVCLDRLRSRPDLETPETPETAETAETPEVPGSPRGEGRWSERTFGLADPEETALHADAVGVALLAVLETVTPAERLAFVMHDVFALPFDEAAEVAGGTPTAARQLASATRRRLQGTSGCATADTNTVRIASDVPTDAATDADRVRRRRVVEAFLAASRQRDFVALRSLLDPDAVLRADTAADGEPGALGLVRGAHAVADAFAAHTRDAHLHVALVDGEPGLVWAPGGWPEAAFAFTIADDGERVTGIDVLADPDHLVDLDTDTDTDTDADVAQ